MTYRAIDICCRAGGASVGLQRAGFEVVLGVDIQDQPSYPFRFARMDAIAFLEDMLAHRVQVWLEAYADFLWLSPPCQAHSWSARKHVHAGKEYPDLLGPCRELAEKSGLPYIIENVVGAPLIDPIKLTGPQLGLQHRYVDDPEHFFPKEILGIHRPRLFESNIPLVAPPWVRPNGNVREGKFVTVAGHGGNSPRYSFEIICDAMGIHWMNKRPRREDNLHDICESVPPAYAEYLGRQVIEYLETGEIKEAV